jgi:hypothetical protein
MIREERRELGGRRGERFLFDLTSGFVVASLS